MSSSEGSALNEISVLLGKQLKEIFWPKIGQNHDYSFERPKIKPWKPEKKPKPWKKDPKTIEKALKRQNFEKDKIISMMESEIGILYDQIKKKGSGRLRYEFIPPLWNS